VIDVFRVRECRSIGNTVGVLPIRSLRGRLLVATPPLSDPNFDRSVLLIVDHTPQGAVGVVLNRRDPTFHHVAELGFESAPLDGWQARMAEPQVLFRGGPVAEHSIIAIGRGSVTDPDSWGAITDSLGTIDLTLDPSTALPGLVELRIFRGYSGWGAGQLEAELAEGAWMVFDLELTDVFTAQPDALWRDVVRRQGGRLTWIADAPEDLSHN
jgi:putative transcriptional regulator